MRSLIHIGLFLVASLGAYSQRRGGFPPMSAPVVRPAPPISAPLRVLPWGTIRSPDESLKCGRLNSMGTGIIPYVVPYPVYSNGGNEPEVAYPYEQQFPPAMDVPPQQPAPPVTMNQHVPDPGANTPPANSAAQVYQAASSPPEPAEPQRSTLFIALRDGWVYTASDYWVESGTLHYITTQGKHNQVSLDLVDRQTSARLNHGGKFELPAR